MVTVVKLLPQLVSNRFQILFHSPDRGSFHLSLTFTIGRWIVLRLGRWSSRIPTRFHVPRSTQVPPALFSVSDTGLSPAVVWLSSQLLLPTPRSRTAALQPQTVETVWFGLIPFRSPLLWESRLISFPLGTEMFHFPRSAPQKRYGS